MQIDYTQRKLFEILLNQKEIRLYLLFSDLFQIDLIRFQKDFSVRRETQRKEQLLSNSFQRYNTITIL